MILEELGERFAVLVGSRPVGQVTDPALGWSAFCAVAGEDIVDLGVPAEDLLMAEAGLRAFPPSGWDVAGPANAVGISLARHLSPPGGEMMHLTVSLYYDVSEFTDLDAVRSGVGVTARSTHFARWRDDVARSAIGPALERHSCLLGFWDTGEI